MKTASGGTGASSRSGSSACGTGGSYGSKGVEHKIDLRQFLT
jgi:hypothetical protein